MKTIAGHLRQARSEVIPLIPQLAPGLAVDQLVIQQQLLENLAGQGLARSDVAPADLNKLERHTIAGFLIHQQRRVLVAGDDRSAKFRELVDSRPALGEGDRFKSFESDLQDTLSNGAWQVESLYKRGWNAEHRWWPLAKGRYEGLGRAAITAHGIGSAPLEGYDLSAGMRTRALSSTLAGFIPLVIAKAEVASVDTKTAAHNLSYLMTSLAGLHFQEFVRGGNFTLLSAPLQQSEAGVYRLAGTPRDESNQVYPRHHPDSLPNTRLKCPVHVAPIPDLGRRGRQGQALGASHTAPRLTNLELFIHAALNAAAGRGLLTRS